ncbi:unnamed protein product [Clavelina lepadiformis]|uniref:Uncharacterized protein n=1 Tax=Clavelina lepadiformis TaxID=159417 RepID=A0ABP0GDW2_CLALP
MEKQAFLLLLIATVVTGRGVFDYRPLHSGRCNWAKAAEGYRWSEGFREGCLKCTCTEKDGSLWKECETHPRPTSWLGNCEVQRNDCKYEVVRVENQYQLCKVLAYTSYSYLTWVSDKDNMP